MASHSFDAKNDYDFTAAFQVLSGQNLRPAAKVKCFAGNLVAEQIEEILDKCSALIPGERANNLTQAAAVLREHHIYLPTRRKGWHVLRQDHEIQTTQRRLNRVDERYALVYELLCHDSFCVGHVNQQQTRLVTFLRLAVL